MKKLLAILLAALLVLGMTFSAFAAEEEGQGSGTTAEVGEAEEPEEVDPTVQPHADMTVPKEYVNAASGEVTEVYPKETLSFTVMPDDGNPDKSTITVEPIDTAETLDVTIKFPTYTKMGVYKYTVMENAGDTLGVEYDTTGIQVLVTVVNAKAGEGEEDVLAVYVAVYKLTETGEVGPKIEGDDENEIEEPGAAAFTNKYGTGSLKVSKEVTGNLASNKKEFTIHVVFSGGAQAGSNLSFYYGEDADSAQEIEWEDGMARADILLKDGMSVSFINIPAGITYTVQEDGKHLEGKVNSEEGYTVTYTAENVETNEDEVEFASGAIEAGDEDEVDLLNEKKTEIVTGIFLDSLPYVLIGAAVIAAVVIMVIRKKRNSEEE